MTSPSKEQTPEVYQHKMPYVSYYTCLHKIDGEYCLEEVSTKDQAIYHVRETNHEVQHWVGFAKVFTQEEELEEWYDFTI